MGRSGLGKANNPAESTWRDALPPRWILWASLAVFGGLPLSCCIITGWRDFQDNQLYDIARRLGGSTGVMPGAAGWDGAGISCQIDLELTGTTTGDADFNQIARLPAFVRVVSVSLRGTKITDATLDLLKEIIESESPPNGPRLRAVDLTDTSVTEAKVLDLGRRRPWTDFAYGSSKSANHTRGPR